MAEDAPRAGVVDAAVIFLRSPRVAGSDPAHARAYLQQKGLTSAEIALAFERAALEPGNAPTAAQPQPQPQPQQGSVLGSVARTAMLAAGAYAALSTLRGFLSGSGSTVPSAEQQQQQQQLHQTLEQMQSLCVATRETLAGQATQLQALDSRVTQMEAASNSAAAPLDDIRRELASLKSLLLNPRQFPTVQAPAVPTIPAWQKSRLLRSASEQPASETASAAAPSAVPSNGGSGGTHTSPLSETPEATEKGGDSAAAGSKSPQPAAAADDAKPPS